MDYAAGFVPYLLAGQREGAKVLGTDIMWSTQEVYNLQVTTLALIAMVMKAIQDLHPTGATDAAWQQRLNTALDTGLGGDRSGWPGWVVLQVRPEDLATYGATTADSVASLRAKIAAYNAGGQ